MREHVYGYVIRKGYLLKRAAEINGVIPGEGGYTSNDILLGSFVNLAKDAGIFGQVLLAFTEIKGKDEMVMALASNNPGDFLPTYPALPDSSIVEKLKAILETEAAPRWYRTI